MPAAEYRRELAVTVGILLLLSGLLAFICYGSEISVWLYVAFAAGPFTGWVSAVLETDIDTGLWSLIPLTFFSIWPAVRASKANTATSRRWRLALAASAWLFSGFFYAFVIWL